MPCREGAADTSVRLVANVGLEDIDIMADTLSIASMGPNIGTDVNLDLEMGLQPPRRTYNPRCRVQRSPEYGHEESQASPVSSSTVPMGALDPDAIVRKSRTPDHEPAPMSLKLRIGCR